MKEPFGSLTCWFLPDRVRPAVSHAVLSWIVTVVVIVAAAVTTALNADARPEQPDDVLEAGRDDTDGRPDVSLAA